MVTLIRGGAYSTEDKWVLLDKTMDLPENAVLGGIDPEGYYNYVGRVVYSSSIVPARVVPELGRATYNTETLSNQAASYEVLVANETVSYHWIRSFDGYREKNAVIAGTNALNDRVYICRARSDESLIVGILLLAQRACIIKYENLPLRTFEKYEILVREHKVAQAGNLSLVVPDNAIWSGFDPYGYNTYAGRVKNGNDILPARVVLETGTAYFNTETTSGKLLVYDLLVAERPLNYVWVRSFDGFYEKGLVAVGTTIKNERVYFCRAKSDAGILTGTLLLSQKQCIIKHESLSLRKFEKYEVLLAQQKTNETIY
ncbi:hypothetical protein KR018_006186 [Drosophila ironensis]|nr:hypothetical protein KR018_006186 [Drosophila ironensis]